MIKKILALVALLTLSVGVASAQTTALVDMEYLMSRLPAYTKAQKQLEEQSQKWQAEVSKFEAEAATLYKAFQAEAGSLNAQQRQAREDAIIAKEKQAYELKRKYFSPEGELVKRREALMKPIQTEIWNSLKEIALARGLQLILDKSTGKIIYADPAIDYSGIVLQKMGYGN